MRTSISFGGFGRLAPTLVAVDAAEAAGLDGVWMCEHVGFTDGIVPAALAATRTTGIEVGIVGAAPVSRHPGLFAMELASLAAVAPGRIRAQVGLGAMHLVGALGADHRRGLSTARELIGVLRELLAGKRVTGVFAGHRFDGFAIRAPAVAPPIDLMAIRPRMLELAARAADGVSLTAGASTAYLRAAVDAVTIALEAAGRDRSAFRISATVMGAVAADRDKAAAMLRPVLAAYPPDEFAVTAPDVFDPGELAAGRLTLETEAIAAIAVVATPQTLPAVLAEWAGTGIDEIALGLANPTDEVPAMLAALGRAAR